MGNNPLRTGIHSLKAGSRKMRKDYNASVSRALHLAGVFMRWRIRHIEAENNRKEEEETSDSNSCSG